jgi:hypothetical protein
MSAAPCQSAPAPRWWKFRATALAWLGALAFLAAFAVAFRAEATPANRAGLSEHYDRFLSKELNRCTTCHLPSERTDPLSLDEFPHNPFGHRLKLLGEERAAAGGTVDIAARLASVADEDSDGDGIANEDEILLGRQPGVATNTPQAGERALLSDHRGEFARYLASYRWRPFASVVRPPAPDVNHAAWVRNPIDAFLAASHEKHGLTPRPEATREVLLRRLYFDLIGLPPTPEEQHAFLAEASEQAYERVVERLLEDPRHGERWSRHWMDIWRYSDWAGWSGGNQIRDSKPHIWRWRDWIVESVNADKGYNHMLIEMLAADELAPLDTDALRATGFLVRNYKMLSREQWMEDTIKHTSQAFLGVTIGCAKCHDHMTDPIAQSDYYRMRAIFDPHQVRTDRVPGETDVTKDGLVRAYDATMDSVTPLLIRGDERHPDKNRLMSAGVPVALCGDTSLANCGGALDVHPVRLPFLASQPDRREFVRRDVAAASARALTEVREVLAKISSDPATETAKLAEQEFTVALADAKHSALLATLKVETLEDAGRKDTEEWSALATETTRLQRNASLAEATLKRQQAATVLQGARAKADASHAANETATAGAPEPGAANDSPEAKAARDAFEKAAMELEVAEKKLAEAEKALAGAEEQLSAEPSTAYQPRPVESYPAESTGRRLVFARWIADPKNPLTARVAMNHVWLRHFGRGIVPTPADFGRSGRPPSHPELLDWLAAEFTAQNWSLKEMHRLIVTSSAYRMASTPDQANAATDPDNVYLWRMPSRRLEAEAVRDSLLFASGNLEMTMGGPEIDHNLGLVSKRRSLYLRLAAEKEVEFLRIFDGPMVTECYERRPSVMPQQALALANSELVRREAEALAAALSATSHNGDDFVAQAYARVLARPPLPEEIRLCREFLKSVPITNAGADSPGDPHQQQQRRRGNLMLVLFNHNDFVTIR